MPTPAVPFPPPASLSEAARTVWVDLVSAHDAEHFQEGDATLLSAYCEAAALSAAAAQALQAGDDSRLKVWERSTAIMASLSLRLRLGPQSRRERQAGKPRTLTWSDKFALQVQQDGQGRRPWEDD